MIQIEDLFLSIPKSWQIVPFDRIILGSRKQNRLGIFQILLGYKHYFSSFPSHEKCLDVLLSSMSIEDLPTDPNDFFRGSHDGCCLVGAIVSRREKSIKRMYYKYINNKFILAVYESSRFDTNEVEIYTEIEECDKMVESINFN